MSLFGSKATRIAIVDVRSSSVGAAYVLLEANKPPTLVYSARVPIDPHATEPLSEAVPRTIENALNQLVKTGAPLLHAAAGSASVERVFVTLTAPWQRSRVFSRVVEKEKPFVFTKQTISESREATDTDEEGWTRVSEFALATLLNGYEVANPFGKRINRAEILMLSSSLENSIMETIRKSVHKALHQRKIEFSAFMPEAYTVFRDLYPHQRDFLIMDIGNDASDVLLAKHGLLVSLECMAHGVAEMGRIARSAGYSSPSVPRAEATTDGVHIERDASFAAQVDSAEAAWLAEIRTSLAALAKQEPLSRTVFLIAEDNVRDFLRHLLDSPDLRSLWLSDEAITILPVLPGQFAPFLAQGSVQPADPALALVALASAKRMRAS